ncbi:Septin-4 [Wickerhamomyces ciferrii]|uniref:Septin-4 n=1 Tax=Wickerhamomyces ciferrii (strain ATCC 14091 / BCRC 22168 / CBS 111 / JCM 3599 / NBRC 0793 / NRRL Y-1031 F-60-10) TaxID=1206466 RepID=K0KN78_WICCF|nr:Septin-4 [Wickerhamomyces ciferrii]CCH42804.1 Septin-4 [Wickerhamomyces ciferrii]
MALRNIVSSSPEEIRRRKILKKGIKFTLLITGEEGSGKSSFINTLCNQQVISKAESKKIVASESHLSPGLNIIKKHVDIIEKNATPINLDIILTPGFGDNVDNSDVTGDVIKYLDQQFDEVLSEEIRITRNTKFEDGRPHACLYFIRPTSKGLRELDVEAMKRLASKVNVIPIISKSDTLTEDEISLNKALILQDIKANGIKVYDFSQEVDEDSEFLDEVLFLKNNLPFAIAGSFETKKKSKVDGVDYEEDGTNNDYYHVREYPWGTFKVEDLNHSDFNYIRNVLFGSHLQELKDTTHTVLYESFRRQKLSENNKKLRKSSRTSVNNDEDEASLLDRYSYANETVIAESEAELFSQDEDALREILEKKKAIENYALELKALEKRFRVSSISQNRNSKIAGSEVSTTNSFNI